MDFLTFLPSLAEILREPAGLWWERAQLIEPLHEAYLSLPAARREELPRVIAASEFAGSALIQDPGALAWIAQHWVPDSASAANGEFERDAASATDPSDSQR